MEVDAKLATLKPTGDKLKFHNLLDGGAGAPTVSLTFYEVTANGEKGALIPGFCQEQDPFQVGGAGQEDCTPTQPNGYFKYDIAAAGYNTLDPMIIIEHADQALEPPGDIPIVGVVVGLALVALIVGYLIGRGRGTA